MPEGDIITFYRKFEGSHSGIQGKFGSLSFLSLADSLSEFRHVHPLSPTIRGHIEQLPAIAVVRSSGNKYIQLWPSDVKEKRAAGSIPAIPSKKQPLHAHNAIL